MEEPPFESNAQLTSEWFECVWNHNDHNHIRKRMDPKVIFHLPQIEGNGIDAFVRFQTTFRGAFKGVWVEVGKLVENSSGVVGKGNLTAIHRETRKPIDIDFSISLVWKNGKMVECRSILDFDDLMGQVGKVDPSLTPANLAESA